MSREITEPDLSFKRSLWLFVEMLKPGGGREGGTRLKAELGIRKLLAKIQVRGNGDLDLGGNGRDSRWSDFGCVLKIDRIY